jgi:hypothetical protein
MRFNDIIEIQGKIFVVDYTDTIYAGEYDVLRLHEEYESIAADAIKDTDVSVGMAATYVQALTAELVAMTISDRMEITNVRYIGE